MREQSCFIHSYPPPLSLISYWNVLSGCILPLYTLCSLWNMKAGRLVPVNIITMRPQEHVEDRAAHLNSNLASHKGKLDHDLSTGSHRR